MVSIEYKFTSETFREEFTFVQDSIRMHISNGERCTGGQRRWEESEVNDVLSSKVRTSLGGGPANSIELQDNRRAREGHLESSGQKEADDIFESEFTMLQDLWKFDNFPFPVTKQVSMLSADVMVLIIFHVFHACTSCFSTRTRVHTLQQDV